MNEKDLPPDFDFKIRVQIEPILRDATHGKGFVTSYTFLDDPITTGICTLKRLKLIFDKILSDLQSLQGSAKE